MMGKILISLGAFACPILVVFLCASLSSDIRIGTIDPASASYKDALGTLLSASQTMVTVALSIAAAEGLVVAHNQNVGARFNALFGFLCLLAVIVSIYFSARIGYWGSYTLAANSGEIAALTHSFDRQAFLVLLAGSALCATVVRQALK